MTVKKHLRVRKRVIGKKKLVIITKEITKITIIYNNMYRVICVLARVTIRMLSHYY